MRQPLRALLLAAGLGTRLRPITTYTPKCLVPIGGEPLLGRWLRKLEAVGCDSVLVNTHYLADQVDAFLQNWHSSTMSVQASYEPQLLGTAGTLLANQQFFQVLQVCLSTRIISWRKNFLPSWTLILTAIPVAYSPC